MPPPAPISAFLSLQPLEPVFVFNSSEDAERFQNHLRQGRLLHNHLPGSRWVYMPMPNGLLRVRTALMRGGVAFDFDGAGHAREFQESILHLGKIYSNTNESPVQNRTVYLGSSPK
ncbi:hypothetical protein K504DRAFT_497804 [Pleomassaria siparia CBS 279.74]|uniref:Uncharacterized protein n=1 Tax=Pleomassaria siparia CBS 279.74 TaxID=1314801 RepID=A0A6G1KKS9_9PLEO|nr:hypothetical protein K504DRAFT_497804 [Pleomassaria siparia CBS 279.74]